MRQLLSYYHAIKTCRGVGSKARSGRGRSLHSSGGHTTIDSSVGHIVWLSLAVLEDRTLGALSTVHTVATAFGKSWLINHHTQSKYSSPRQTVVTAYGCLTSYHLNEKGLNILDIGSQVLVPALRPKAHC
jgi:hypothetical protein